MLTWGAFLLLSVIAGSSTTFFAGVYKQARDWLEVCMVQYIMAVIEIFIFNASKCSNETFYSFKTRNFRIFTSGMFISSIGGWMQGMALSWLVYRVTGSVADLGLVIFAGNLPLLFLLFIGGVAADRHDKRKILLACNALAMLQAVILTYLVYSGEVGLGAIIVLSVMLGCTIAFEVPARQSLVPTLVTDKQHLANALGLSSASFHVARMVGPALGGVIIARYGEALCFFINAISFIAALIALLSLRLPTAPVNTHHLSAEACTRVTRFAAAAARIWLIVLRPGIYTLLFLAAFVTTFGLQYTVLLPVIVDRLLNSHSIAYGWLNTAGGIGALMGSLTIAYLGHKKGRRLRIGLACLTLSLALVVLAFSQNLILSMVAVVVAGVCLAIHWNGGNSLMQQGVEAHCRGKMMGVYTTFTLGLAPLTSLLAGFIAQRFGVQMALILSAAGIFLGASCYLWQVRVLDDVCL